MSSTYKARLVKQFHAKKIINDLTQLLSSIISSKENKEPETRNLEITFNHQPTFLLPITVLKVIWTL